ncbi:hypothetical protein VTJ49DRAFT_5536 [Mycothermus thermophilus]|uniref:CCHC-type domain-containing protein n=1 Tax=Humicola insolens TaxID=85995 RepID=A0ABR3V2Y8_HUMIN
MRALLLTFAPPGQDGVRSSMLSYTLDNMRQTQDQTPAAAAAAVVTTIPTMTLSHHKSRACYKCGDLGHQADQCASPHRLCYNCKQPNHESNECPMPRTTKAKQCYHCQGVGHVQAECPTLRLSGGANRCYNCDAVGHIARNCPNPTVPGLARAPVRGGFAHARGGFVGGARHATCYKCGGPNHFARDCQAQAMKCYACGKLGHISRDCTAPGGGPLNTAGRTCYTCGKVGHISRECTEGPANANGEQKTDADVNGAAPAAAPQPIAPPAVSATVA